MYKIKRPRLVHKTLKKCIGKETETLIAETDPYEINVVNGDSKRSLLNLQMIFFFN